MQKNLSSTKAVLLEIKQLTDKRDYLRLLFSLTNYKDCTMMFSAFHEIEGRQFHFVRQEHFPFNMAQEFQMLLEDAIANYNSDIAALNQHLKNI
jgi:folylpolyglutamate synthase/dihydropteroate synthase